MKIQYKVYLLAFSFSTLVSVVYSFTADKFSGAVIACLMFSVFYISQLSTLALNIQRQVDRLNEFRADYMKQRKLALNMLIDKLHRPSVKLVSSQISLVKSIGAEIRKQSDDPTNPVIFVGAISMQTPNENDAQAESTAIYDDEDEQSPFQIYQGALEEASSKGFAIYRIIKLPTPVELSKRSRKWARDYLRWLDNQLSQLSRNSNYILINSPRAPKWGAAGARIILNESMFDITYKGGDTVQLRDRLIAKLQKERILSSAFMGEYSNIDVYCNDKLKAKNHFGPVNALSSEDFAAFVQSCRQEFDIKFT